MALAAWNFPRPPKSTASFPMRAMRWTATFHLAWTRGLLSSPRPCATPKSLKLCFAGRAMSVSRVLSICNMLGLCPMTQLLVRFATRSNSSRRVCTSFSTAVTATQRASGSPRPHHVRSSTQARAELGPCVSLACFTHGRVSIARMSTAAGHPGGMQRRGTRGVPIAPSTLICLGAWYIAKSGPENHVGTPAALRLAATKLKPKWS